MAQTVKKTVNQQLKPRIKRYIRKRVMSWYTIKTLYLPYNGHHIVAPTFIPFYLSISLFFFLWNLTLSFDSKIYLSAWLAPVLYYIETWIFCVVMDGVLHGKYTRVVLRGLRIGFFLFLVSEGMFFFSFFWAYFHFSLSPSIWIGCVWPPLGITAPDPLGIPLLNTVLLISSGTYVNHSYAVFNINKKKSSIFFLWLTIGWGLFFLFCQLIEYYSLPFTMSASVYGSIFYLLTGFHGFHVFVGLYWLSYALSYLSLGALMPKKGSLGFETAVYYWHFVDVIWVLLYLIVYCMA